MRTAAAKATTLRTCASSAQSLECIRWLDMAVWLKASMEDVLFSGFSCWFVKLGIEAGLGLLMNSA